jgi:hypothetical protein
MSRDLKLQMEFDMANTPRVLRQRSHLPHKAGSKAYASIWNGELAENFRPCGRFSDRDNDKR